MYEVQMAVLKLQIQFSTFQNHFHEHTLNDNESGQQKIMINKCKILTSRGKKKRQIRIFITEINIYLKKNTELTSLFKINFYYCVLMLFINPYNFVKL